MLALFYESVHPLVNYEHLATEYGLIQIQIHLVMFHQPLSQVLLMQISQVHNKALSFALDSKLPIGDLYFDDIIGLETDIILRQMAILQEECDGSDYQNHRDCKLHTNKRNS